MVVTNHPLASAAGAEMLAAGGNAVDAAVAALFALSVVEPMMVGLLGGGFAHLRLPDGTHAVLEGQGRCPAAVGPTSFTPDPQAASGMLDAVGRRNVVGRAAVAVPGNLMAWCELLARHGRLPLAGAEVEEPVRAGERAGAEADRGVRGHPQAPAPGDGRSAVEDEVGGAELDVTETGERRRQKRPGDGSLWVRQKIAERLAGHRRGGERWLAGESINAECRGELLLQGGNAIGQRRAGQTPRCGQKRRACGGIHHDVVQPIA
jgi:hypothetical protein